MLETFLMDVPPVVEGQIEALMEGGLGDGFPLIPPTRAAVNRMIGASGFEGGEIIGIMAPLMQEATVEDAAICTVAAGCKPEYFAVVVASLEAMMDPEFNLLAIQATTELASTLLIVNGSIGDRLGIQSGSGCLGPGYRANATIGRAVRLAGICIGGAVPGETDMATFGHAGKFTSCFAEAEADSPWEPFHVGRGFSKQRSAVTVVGADAPVNVNDFSSASAQSVLKMIAETMSYPGSNNAQGGGEVLIVVSPGHVELFDKAGMTRRDVQEALFERARVPLDRFSPEITKRVLGKRKQQYGEDVPDPVPVADDPDSILVAVAGGPGSHTLFFPTYGETIAVTRVINESR
ncbi:MAG: hypothetical protein VCE91_03865 [Nitrospinota bacterium]